MAVTFQTAAATAEALQKSLAKVIRGRDDTIGLLVAALIADGHVLLEDYPGSGKTTLTKTLGRLIDAPHESASGDHILPFRRIQFTPDMLPGDVLGVNVFDPKVGQFHFVHGPVFAHVVLADELNRTGPKVQAAFLECMAEKQVTIDNETHKLDDLFFVVGTQNPLDLAGTYPLPLVQLDRFLLKLPMRYVDAKTEVDILENHTEIIEHAESLAPVCTRDDLLKARMVSRGLFISNELRRAIVGIVQATRKSPLLQFGASTRAAIMLQEALKAWALTRGRDHATEDDLKAILPFVLLHRLQFHGGAGDPKEALMSIAAPVIDDLIAGRLKD